LVLQTGVTWSGTVSGAEKPYGMTGSVQVSSYILTGLKPNTAFIMTWIKYRKFPKARQ
jgi:hypothetical protein